MKNKKRKHIRHRDNSNVMVGTVKHKKNVTPVKFTDFDAELDEVTKNYASAIQDNEKKLAEEHLKSALNEHFTALEEIYAVNKTMDAVYNPQSIETARYDKQDILDAMNHAIASYDRYVETTPAGIRAQDFSYDDLDSDNVQKQAIDLLQVVEKQVKITGFTADKIDDPRYDIILNLHEEPLVLENLHLLLPRTQAGFEQDMAAFYTYLTMKLSPKDSPVTTFALMKVYLDYRTLLWVKSR